ncbi:regulatory iron-sulfur-containing complex subunit RicT, partial [Bacteroides acidifaciens]
PLQMKKANFKADTEIKRVYRKAKPVDMEKFNEAKGKEHATMIRARQIALNLSLNMKIGDVEYQGDGNKAIFYYIADERVDFRQLIKVLAEVFRVRIEMKQIGARQEAGRIGGIGPCGRELCCATWMTSFVSVSTSAARYQDISLNPQKLAGQCAKLKCCLNYEVDCYVEAQKRLPSKEIELETKDGTFYFFKADILSNQISYSTDKSFPANLVTISGKRAFEIISMNRKGVKPDSLVEEERKPEPKKPVDLLEQESVTRFDRSRNNKDSGNNGNRNNKKKKKGNNNNNNRSQQQAGGENRPQQPQRENDNRSQPSENGNRGERENRPRNNNNNNRNRGQNQGRNNENRRPERPQGQERPQNQERSQNQERPRNQDRQQNLDRQQNQDQDRPERPQGQERRPRPERGERPERNPNQEKPQNNNEKPSQK